MIELICEWGAPRHLSAAMQQADMTATIGATWAKWQLLEPKRLASKSARRYWDKELGGEESQLETFQKVENFDPDEWLELANHCRSIGVKFLATPFDLRSVNLLEGIGVEAYKIASGDITYKALYKKINQTGKRVFFSTGASSIAEIRSARGWLKHCAPVAMACDLVYPCPAEQSELRQQLQQLVDEGITSQIGYSDHTQEVVTGAVAVANGARILEKHCTLDPEGDAPDDKMALTPDKATEYLRLANDALALTRRIPTADDPERAARIEARRSAHAARPLPAGLVLKDTDIHWLRPALPGSIPPTSKLADRTLAQAVAKGEQIKRSDLA